MAYKLTLEHVKAEARKAYQEKRLLAQNPSVSNGLCLYHAGGCGCAIGVALPPEVHEAIDEGEEFGLNASGLNELVDMELISVDPSERMAMREIQIAHDNWLDSDGYDLSRQKKCEKRFLELIGT